MEFVNSMEENSEISKSIFNEILVKNSQYHIQKNKSFHLFNEKTEFDFNFLTQMFFSKIDQNRTKIWSIFGTPRSNLTSDS